MRKVWFGIALFATGMTLAGAPVRRDRFQNDPADSPNAIYGVTAANAQPGDLIFFLPAQVGGVVFTTASNVVGWPIKIIARTIQGDFSTDSFVPPNDFSVRYVGTPAAYAIGAPFWCLKKAFWDGPVWLFSGSESDPEIDMY